MISARIAVLLCLAVLVSACSHNGNSARTGSRRAPPLPGWIEFVLQDREIPADPLVEAGSGPRAPACDLELLLNGESVISLGLTPSGVSPPYSLDSRFRIRAFSGKYTAVVHYSSCRNYGSRPDSREAAIELLVAPGGITRTHFDGSVLTARAPQVIFNSKE